MASKTVTLYASILTAIEELRALELFMRSYSLDFGIETKEWEAYTLATARANILRRSLASWILYLTEEGDNK